VKTFYAKYKISLVDEGVADILNHVGNELYLEGRDILVNVCEAYVAINSDRFVVEEN
jgi:hypothetical protein